MKTIRDFDIKNQTILIRVDYNVPLKNGQVESDLRIRASLPTLQYLLEHGARKLILISHLGRPKGKTAPEFSLSPVADTLRELLPDQKIGFYPLPDTAAQPNPLNIPDDVKIALLENLRFNPGEEANDPDFIQSIIDTVHANVFVQDGFAVVHRAHASTDAVKNFLPVYAGFLVENEVKNLSAALNSAASDEKKLLIVGGAKVEDKEPLIAKFTPSFDYIFVGGKIAADGYRPQNPKITVAADFDENAKGDKLDIGPLSTGQLASFIVDADLIIWNGLLGFAEDPAYATSSTLAAELIGEKKGTTTIICGGDTTGFVEHLAEEHPHLSYSLVSTGGGAALEFLLGKKLPGLEAILS